MHIVFATPGFIEKNGPTTGLPKYLLRVSLILKQWGHDVTIVTCSERTICNTYRGIDVRRIRVPAIKKTANERDDAIAAGLINGQLIRNEIDKLASEKKIDLVQYTSLSGLAYYRRDDIPSITRLSSYAKMWEWEGHDEYQSGKAELEREAAIRSDAVFGPSYVVANELGKDIKREIDVIETPFVLEEEKEDLKTYNKLFNNRKYILFFGSLVKYKGIGILSECAYDILSNNPNLFIGIVGDGSYKYVERMLINAKENSERIIYSKAVGFSELMPIIKNAEAIVLPSISENFSNACIESLALGKIVIGTRGASFDQMIDDGESGFLCEIGDSISLKKAIQNALSISKEEKLRIEENARKRAEKLKPEVVVEQLLEYYNRVIENYKQ